MMICPKCGSSYEDNIMFCVHCGAKLQPEDDEYADNGSEENSADESKTRDVGMIIVGIVATLAAICVAVVLIIGFATSNSVRPSDYFTANVTNQDGDDGDEVATNSNFTITSYNSIIDVKDWNTRHISESISVDIKNEIHGIFIKIPKVCTVNRKDGSKYSTAVRIDGVSCSSDDLQIEESDDACTIKMGDSNKLIKGKHKYKFEYDWILDDYSFESDDVFEHNVIGDGWDTTIAKAKFTVRMPSETKFKSDNIEIYYSKSGLFSDEGVDFEVEGNEINSVVSHKLKPGEGLIFRLSLQ